MKQQRLVSVISILAISLGFCLFPGLVFADESPPTDHTTTKLPQSEQAQDRPAPETLFVRQSTPTEAQSYLAQRSIFATDTAELHWMWIIARNAVWGGILGGLIGFGAYLVTGLEWNPWTIAQFAGGGILVGAATGVIEAAFWVDQPPEENDRPASVEWVEREMPRTYPLPLLRLQF